MKKSYFDKAKEFVIEAYAKIGKDRVGCKHFENTVEWIKRLRPNADEALLIAGFAHDIDRAFAKDTKPLYIKGFSLVDKNIVKAHQRNGAKIISKFLQKEGASEELIKKVSFLVEYHEEGGNSNTDLLKDADSLSYFDVNAERHIEWLKIGVSKKQLREKMDWMFNRISSKKAKKIAEPMYKKAIKLLEDA